MIAPKTINNPMECILEINTNKNMRAMERMILAQTDVRPFFVSSNSVIRNIGNTNIRRELYLIKGNPAKLTVRIANNALRNGCAKNLP